MLQRLVHAARELGGARYAALGVPDGEGGFARFITSGMSDELITAMGPLPRTHGMLGAMLESRRALPHARHPRARALPRLVAGGASGHALVPRRADRRPRRHHRGAVPDREGGRRDVLRRGRAADRAARGACGDRDGERAPVRAQPRAEHRRGAQPARARAARLGHAAAVRRRARGRVGVRAARARRGRRRRAARARPGARARGDGGAALRRVRAAAGLAGGGGARAGPAQARRGAAARVGARDRAAGRLAAGARRRRGRAGVPDRAGGAAERPAPCRRRADRGAARGRRRRASP